MRRVDRASPVPGFGFQHPIRHPFIFRLPRVIKYLAVPGSLVKLLIVLKTSSFTRWKSEVRIL
jgi:hypothetical protein